MCQNLREDRNSEKGLCFSGIVCWLPTMEMYRLVVLQTTLKAERGGWNWKPETSTGMMEDPDEASGLLNSGAESHILQNKSNRGKADLTGAASMLHTLTMADKGYYADRTPVPGRSKCKSSLEGGFNHIPQHHHKQCMRKDKIN